MGSAHELRMCFHGDLLVINSLEGSQDKPAFFRIQHHQGSILPRATHFGKLTCVFRLWEGKFVSRQTSSTLPSVFCRRTGWSSGPREVYQWTQVYCETLETDPERGVGWAVSKLSSLLAWLWKQQAAPSNRLWKGTWVPGGGLKTDIFVSCVLGWVFLASILKFIV